MSNIDFLSINITCKPAFVEILIAELSELNYTSMLETDNGLEAYIKPLNYKEEDMEHLIKKYKQADIEYEVEEVAERNWNEEWEQNYEPIVVDDRVMVRATFHEEAPQFEHELIISPRMSFGTGHHATTYLMLKNQLSIDHHGKKVLDAGCGTAILAIMAEKLGAREVVAYDNDAWSIENAPFNIDLNSCQKITVKEDVIESLKLPRDFDIILANINKNVLLEEMRAYVEHLHPKGTIVFSGFYEKDEQDLKETAISEGLTFKRKFTRDNWSSLLFTKS